MKNLIKSFLDYVKGILSAPDGEPSSKRVITMIAMLLISIGFVANLFWDQNIDQFILESVMYILVAGMGITGVEKFIPKRDAAPKE